MELSKMLRDYSRTIAGKEQLLISAIAKALEIIPRQLCDNAGFDATNILNKLRQKHAQGKSFTIFYDFSINFIIIYDPIKGSRAIIKFNFIANSLRRYTRIIYFILKLKLIPTTNTLLFIWPYKGVI